MVVVLINFMALKLTLKFVHTNTQIFSLVWNPTNQKQLQYDLNKIVYPLPVTGTCAVGIGSRQYSDPDVIMTSGGWRLIKYRLVSCCYWCHHETQWVISQAAWLLRTAYDGFNSRIGHFIF